MDAGLKFLDRHDLTFEGNGATLRSNGDVHEASSLFALWSGDTGIVIHDFNLVGNSPSPGVYLPGQEGAHGVLIGGGGNVDVSDVTISGVYGDAFYVGGWADGVSIHDSIVKSNGRNGVAIIAGRNVTVQRVTFDESGYCSLDVEANDSTEGAANIKFLDNLVGTLGRRLLRGRRGRGLGRLGHHGQRQPGDGLEPGHRRDPRPAAGHRVHEQHVHGGRRRPGPQVRPRRRPDRQRQQPASAIRRPGRDRRLDERRAMASPSPPRRPCRHRPRRGRRSSPSGPSSSSSWWSSPASARAS